MRQLLNENNLGFEEELMKLYQDIDGLDLEIEDMERAERQDLLDQGEIQLLDDLTDHREELVARVDELEALLSVEL